MKKKFLIPILSLVCVLTCAFGLVACGGNGNDDVPATGISLNRETQIIDGVPVGDVITCTAGQSMTLTATLKPENATSTIVWSSDKPDIASVDEHGKITGHRAGRATISAKADEKTAVCLVTVNAPSVADFTAEAAAFVRNNIRSQVIGADKGVSDETWTMELNDDNCVSEVDILYMCSSGKTERKVVLATVTFSSDVSFYDVIDNSERNVQCSVEKQTVFTFDEQYNSANQAILDALYKVKGITSDLKLISETEASSSSFVAYNYIVVNNGKIENYNLEVIKDNGSVESIVENIENYFYNTENTGSYSMNGTVIYTEGNTYEK